MHDIQRFYVQISIQGFLHQREQNGIGRGLTKAQPVAR